MLSSHAVRVFFFLNKEKQYMSNFLMISLCSVSWPQFESYLVPVRKPHSPRELQRDCEPWHRSRPEPRSDARRTKLAGLPSGLTPEAANSGDSIIPPSPQRVTTLWNMYYIKNKPQQILSSLKVQPINHLHFFTSRSCGSFAR